MEMNILEESKNRLVFELKGEEHGLCNAIKKALWQNKSVKLSGYAVDHPLINVPKFTIETDGTSPKKVLIDACKDVKKDCELFWKNFDKEVK